MKSIYEFNPSDALDFARFTGQKFKEKTDEIQFLYCPYCQGGRNRDKNTFSINKRTGQFVCLRASCGAHGNMITLSRDFDFSLGTDTDEYFQIRPGRFRNIGKTLTEEDVTPTALDYLRNRGISEEVIKRYRITSQTANPSILVFPFFEPDGKKISFVKYRNTAPKEGESKEWCEANCKPILFGMDQCDSSDETLIITEGQIDTLSVATAGFKNVVSVPMGKNGFTWIPHVWDWLQSFKKLIVFGDCEGGTITLLDMMTTRFGGEVQHVRIEDYRGLKDANDILRKYGPEGIRGCIGNAISQPDPYIGQLWEVEARNPADSKMIPTGFKRLDECIGGLAMGHLIIITGERGRGKSTLAGQFLAKALRSNESVFAYSGELPDYQFKAWIDRQLSAGNGLVSTNVNGRIDYRIQEAQQAAINRSYEGRAYYYRNSFFGSSDETTIILKATERAITQKGCSVILIDNLMSALVDPGQDLNGAQTEFVRKLANMAQFYGVCILLLVHPRKSGNSGRSSIENDDIMGSGNITNLASVVLAYGNPPEMMGRGDRAIYVLKNRLYGDELKGQDGINVWFDPVTKRITDVQGNFTWDSDESPRFVPAEEHDENLPF